MKSFDAYIAYASEDAAFATSLREGLEEAGFAIWQDTVQMTVGLSLREQMEQGLRESEFGVIVLSPTFFQKKWTKAELDGLLALETADEPRILPVWFGVDAPTVVSASPMLGGRSAAVFEGEVASVVERLTQSIIRLGSSRSFAARVRFEIAMGLQWQGQPQFFAQSFALLDEHPEWFVPVPFSIFPDPAGFLQNRGDTKLLPLTQLHADSPMFDGRTIATIAHQVEGSLQVLADRGEAPPGAGLPDRAHIVSYVFRLMSVDSAPGDMVYVQALGPHAEEIRLPANQTDWLTWVSGVPLARGATHDGTALRSTTYLLAMSILYTPNMGDEEAEGLAGSAG